MSGQKQEAQTSKATSASPLFLHSLSLADKLLEADPILKELPESKTDQHPIIFQALEYLDAINKLEKNEAFDELCKHLEKEKPKSVKELLAKLQGFYTTLKKNPAAGTAKRIFNRTLLNYRFQVINDLEIPSKLADVRVSQNTPEAEELKKYLKHVKGELLYLDYDFMNLFFDKTSEHSIIDYPARIYCVVKALQSLDPSGVHKAKLEALSQPFLNLAIQLKAASQELFDISEIEEPFDITESESTSITTSTPERKSTETDRLDFLHAGLSEKNIVNAEEPHGPDRLKKLQEARKILGDESLASDSHNKEGFSTLIYLVLNGFSFLVRNFLSLNNPNLGFQDLQHKLTALHWAAHKGDTLIVRDLIHFIRGNADLLNAQEPVYGCTPLMLSVAQGHLDVIKLLLAAGANLQITKKSGSTALALAVAPNINQTHVAAFLKEFQALGTPPKSTSSRALDSKDDPKKILLTPQQKSFLAFGVANPAGTLEQLEKQQQEQEHVERMAQELIAAIKDSDHRRVKEILNPTQKAEIINRIVNHIDNKGLTPWFYAVQEDNAEAMILLIQYGANVNKLDKSGFAALHIAARDNNADAIETLFSLAIQTQLKIKGLRLNIEVQSFQGNTPLALAAYWGQLDATTALLAAGANSQTLNNANKTLLAITQEHLPGEAKKDDKSFQAKREAVAKCIREFQKEQTKENKLLPTSFLKRVSDERSKKLIALISPITLERITEKYGDDRWENMREAKKHIDRGIDLNFVDGWTSSNYFHCRGNILIYLVMNGYLSLTRQVLQLAPNLIGLQETVKRTSALHWAAHHRNPAIMRALLETLQTTQQLALINITDNFSRTPLMTAIQQGNFETAKLLIATGADFKRKKNQYGKSAYEMAEALGQPELLEFMNHFATAGSPAAPDAKEIRERNSQELAQALKDGDTEEATRLTTAPKSTLSAKDKEAKDVKHSAPSLGFNPHYQDNNDLSLLHLAAIAGDDRLVFSLVKKHKVTINAIDKDGNTALHLAALHNRSAVIETLLKENADLTITNKKGQTPLMLANEAKQTRAVKKIEEFEIRALEIFHDAIKENDQKKIEAFIEKKADLNKADKDGNTALHHAASCGHLLLVVKFLKSGAKPETTNNKKQTSLKLAESQKHTEVVRCIQTFQDPKKLSKLTQQQTQPAAFSLNSAGDIACSVFDEGRRNSIATSKQDDESLNAEPLKNK